MSDSHTSAPKSDNTIRKLEEVTINRIAAGEVVQRPFNAVKEMIENSLDAGAKSISVIAKGGGLDMLQIQDSGHGIRHEDLEIVCERFTTSKISTFEDLKSISTFGFRGEALASITHVATVTILTKTKDAPCAYKTRYRDGKQVGIKPGDAAQPQPCAGMVGTTITVEDMFHNMPTRRKAFKNTSDEYRRILNVMTHYAIHYGDSQISFTCKKHGQANTTPDLHTPSNSSTLDNIKLTYGQSLAKELLPLDIRHEPDEDFESAPDDVRFSLKGYISNANYSSKKNTFILFINNRLVECLSMKRLIDAVYSEILPKHSHPFCYFSLTLPPQHIDVNVHPTKKEVHFLNENKLLEYINAGMSQCLKSANESRTFYATQVLAPVNGIVTLVPSRPQSQSKHSSSKSESLTESTIAEVDENDVISYSDRKSKDKSKSYRLSKNRKKDNLDVFAFAADNNGDGLENIYSDGEDNGRSSENESGSGSGDEYMKVEAGSRKSTRRGKDRSVLYSSSNSHSASKANTNTHTQRGASSSSSSTKRSSIAPNKLVRTDATLQKIDTYYRPVAADTKNNENAGASESAVQNEDFNYSSSSIQETMPMVIDKSDDNIDVTTTTQVEASSQNRKRRKSKATQNINLNTPGAFAMMKCDCCVGRYCANIDEAKTGYRNDSEEMSVMLDSDDEDDEDEIRTRLLQHAKAAQPGATLPVLPRLKVNYSSVHELLSEIDTGCHTAMQSILKQYVYVGVVDRIRSLIQYQTKLYLIHHAHLAQELFRQLALRRFGQATRLRLDGEVFIETFTRAGLDCEGVNWKPEDGDKETIVANVVSLLQEKAEMLYEYFSIGISENGLLTHLPDLLPGYKPEPAVLPFFLLRLATEVNWEDEKECFAGVARELGIFFGEPPHVPGEQESQSESELESDKHTAYDHLSELLSLRLYPAFKAYLRPPNNLTEGNHIIQVAALEELYKVFERC